MSAWSISARSVPLVIFAVTARRSPGRIVLWMIFVFTTVIMVVMFAYADRFDEIRTLAATMIVFGIAAVLALLATDPIVPAAAKVDYDGGTWAFLAINVAPVLAGAARSARFARVLPSPRQREGRLRKCGLWA